MTIRNLEHAFHPRSVAVIGASQRSGSVGAKVFQNIIESGFPGPVWPVNPKYHHINGLACFARVGDLPEAPDLAVIATPAATVAHLVSELGDRGTRAALVLSAGITAHNGLREEILAAARPHLLRIVGPNSLGMLLPWLKLNASFAHIDARPGRVALLSQSGAIATTLIDWARARNIGFSHVVSLGDMADVDVADCIDMLTQDRSTRAILLYLESLSHARKFLSAARAASRIKPIVAIKAGHHALSQKAAATHTGALAGSDAVFGAALERAGIVRVDKFEDMFAAAQVLTHFPPLQTARVAIVTNGGGAGVMALDHLLDVHGAPAVLSDTTLAALDAVLPDAWSHSNPVDILGDAPPERYAKALEIVAGDPGVDAMVVINCPTALASSVEAAQVVAAAALESLVGSKPLIACWLGDFTAASARQRFDAAGIVNFATPAQAILATHHLVQWSRVRELSMRVPSAGADDSAAPRAAAHAIIAAARAQGRTALTEIEAKEILGAYGIRVPTSRRVDSVQGVENAARTLLRTSRAVVVKLSSGRYLHKSDIGGVALGLATPEAARAAADTMAAHFAELTDGDAPEGFTVEDMVDTEGARELLVGATRDPIFGSAILFGAGGTGAEVIADTAVSLPPLDDHLVRDLIGKTRIGALLDGYRNMPPVDSRALEAALLALSQIVVDLPGIEALDINPLLAGPGGAIALDARMVLTQSNAQAESRHSHLAIRPYPDTFRTRLPTRAGGHFLIRAIRPADAALYPRFMEKVTDRDIWWRFDRHMRALPRDLLIQLTQIDYDRAMAFLAIDEISGAMAGVCRLAADPDHTEGEFAILVRSDLQGHGLGWALLTQILDFAKKDGLSKIFGHVHAHNARMIEMCRTLGFRVAADPDDPGHVHVEILLSAWGERTREEARAAVAR